MKMRLNYQKTLYSESSRKEEISSHNRGLIEIDKQSEEKDFQDLIGDKITFQLMGMNLGSVFDKPKELVIQDSTANKDLTTKEQKSKGDQLLLQEPLEDNSEIIK